MGMDICFLKWVGGIGHTARSSCAKRMMRFHVLVRVIMSASNRLPFMYDTVFENQPFVNEN